MELIESVNILTEIKGRNFKCSDLDLYFNKLNERDVSLSELEIAGNLIRVILEIATSEEGKKKKDNNLLLISAQRGKCKILDIAKNISESLEQREKCFEVLLRILPCYVNLLGKPNFPSKEYSELLEIIITNKKENSSFHSKLQECMMYEDMRINFWKALDLATQNLELEEIHVQNILNLIATVVTKFDKPLKEEIGPKQYYCGVKIGLLKIKDLGKCVQNIWQRLSSVDLSSSNQQLLLHTLLERMIFRMEKPIFLTDYFMSCLQHEGAVSILALQGIFTLIQKHNINYPNIYEKLYDMFKPNLFKMHYKTRLFFLADIFLSSLHLPETLVAGFAKRLARLCLQAPPSDIIIMLALISNIIIRHSGLKKLITNLGKHHYESDPYISSEKDPSESKALESSLWEVKLLQHHVIPSVSAASMFIDNGLPSTECDLSDLLEYDSNKIFTRELKKKVKSPPTSYENPSAVKKGFALWELDN